MGIIIKNNLYVLNTENTTYAFFEDGDGILVHLYWGARISRWEDFDTTTMNGEQGYHPDIDRKREECSSYGMMRYKETSVKVTYADGVRDFRYRVEESGMEENHLWIVLKDIFYPFKITLHYVVYEDSDIIERWKEAENDGDTDICLERFFSAEYTLPGQGYRSWNCNGTWADEFKPYEDTLQAGKKVYESLRGAVGHVATPAFFLYRDASESAGEVWAGVLSYSGNFKVTAEQTPYDYLNVQIGISDTDFCWRLKPGEQFTAPPVCAGYSREGKSGMSHLLHRFAHDHVMPESTADKPLRILYNSWEATAFDVECEKQMALADKAAELGVELFVMDDGWFGERSSDHLGLGDWYVNRRKFPDGLKPLIDHVRELGMDFGIWIEPEMVNENSDLYRAHPDWIYRYPTRDVLEGRHQYMLDLTNPQVIEFILDFIGKLLTENNISYIKWDMNRAMGECGTASLPAEEYKSIWVRHIQGFYSIIETLRERFPEVEFEACASGGGRVDFGCLARFDEFWTSDNTDPLDRLTIQEAYTFLYPPKYMRAWITDAANNENRRVPLSFKIHCAMCGALGIGMNLNRASEEEMEQLKGAVALYREIRPLVQFGRLARLSSCRDGQVHALQYDKDGEAVLFVFRLLRLRGRYAEMVKLVNLEEDEVYQFTVEGKTMRKSGAYLMRHGIEFAMPGDFESRCIRVMKAGLLQ